MIGIAGTQETHDWHFVQMPPMLPALVRQARPIFFLVRADGPSGPRARQAVGLSAWAGMFSEAGLCELLAIH